MQANFDREGMIGLLAELVRCPTENNPPDGRENIGQAVLQMHYQRLGLEIDRFSPASLPEYPGHPDFLPRNLEGRENLVGIWKGSGGGRSLLLTGHMDVVPKEPLPWKVTEPYEPLVQGGKMFGRGTADMKAGLACAFSAVRSLKAAGFAPKGDIVLESVVDEEYSGANGTVASRLRGHNPDFAIVLEPSGLNICPACVGGLIFRVGVQGIAGMPYTGESIGNPAYDIADLIGIVRDFGDMRMKETPVPKLWEGTVQGVQIVITRSKRGRRSRAASSPRRSTAGWRWSCRPIPARRRSRFARCSRAICAHITATRTGFRSSASTATAARPRAIRIFRACNCSPGAPRHIPTPRAFAERCSPAICLR